MLLDRPFFLLLSQEIATKHGLVCVSKEEFSPMSTNSGVWEVKIGTPK